MCVCLVLGYHDHGESIYIQDRVHKEHKECIQLHTQPQVPFGENVSISLLYVDIDNCCFDRM